MIKIEGLKTTVEFAKITTRATISINAGMGSDQVGIIRLQQLAGALNIGSKPEKSQIAELPQVELLIHNVKSIDVLIQALEYLKKQMDSSINYLIYAC